MTLPSISPADILFEKRLAALHQTINAVAPLAGFKTVDRVTKIVVPDYYPATTPEQQTQGAAIIAAFAWTQAAQTAYEDAQSPDFAALLSQIVGAVQTNNDYRALAQPTSAAQDKAFLRALAQENTQILKTLAAAVRYLRGR